jgi:hypothetical protein
VFRGVFRFEMLDHAPAHLVPLAHTRTATDSAQAKPTHFCVVAQDAAAL